MLTKSRKLDVLFLSIILVVAGFYVGTNYASSFSGVTKTLGDDFIEVEDLNATYYYLDGTNITDRLGGDWGSTNLTTTGAVSTADLNFTSEFYYNAENRTDSLANPYLPLTYVIETDGTTITGKNGENGQIDYQSTDADVVFNSCSASDGLIFVKAGTYQIDNWNPAGDIIVQGEGQLQTIFNITEANIGIEQNGKAIYRDLQFYSLNDGIAHIVIDASCIFERVYFQFLCHGDTSEAGFLYYRATGDSYAEFYDCRMDLGDGTAGKTTYFFSWDADFDHLYVYGLIIEGYDCGTGYGRAFSTHNGGTFVETISVRDVDIKNWTASGSSDSALVHDADLACETLSMDNIILRDDCNFSGANQQLMITGPMANYMILTRLYLYDRVHFYGARKYTSLDDFIIVGDFSLTSSFDLGVAGVYPKEAHITNGYVYNGSLSINSGYRTVTMENINMYGSRIWIGDEDTGATHEGVRNIKLQTIYAFHNDTDGSDAYDRFIEWNAIATMDGINIDLIDVTLDNMWYCFYGGGNTFTDSTNITLTRLKMGPDLGADYPILFYSNARDGNVTVKIYESDIITDDPPLDLYNEILGGDRFEGDVWQDIDTGAVTYSEYVRNVTISSGTSNETVTHSLPQRGPESFLLITPTSDLSTTCEAWWTTYDTFSDTEYMILVGKAGVEVNTDDDVTFWVYEKLSP